MDTDATTKARITVYTTDPCRRCLRAKDLLRQRNLDFEAATFERPQGDDLTKDSEGRRQLARRTGQMTFPQITIDGRPLGGLKELLEADESGELERLASA